MKNTIFITILLGTALAFAQTDSQISTSTTPQKPGQAQQQQQPAQKRKLIQPGQRKKVAPANNTKSKVHTSTASQTSEWHHQAAADKIELLPGLQYISKTYRIRSSGASLDSKLTTGALGVDYGLSDEIALGGGIFYGSGSLSAAGVSSNVSGLSDLKLWLHAHSDGMGLRLIYGADIGVSPEKQKIKSNGDSNLASGGFSLAPYFGVEDVMGDSLVGGEFTYTYRGDRSVDDQSSAVSSYTYTGGHSFSLGVYYEQSFDGWLGGGRLQYLSTQDSSVSGSSLNDGSSTITATAYGRFDLSENLVLAPELSYASITYSSSSSSIKDASGFALSAVFRYAF